RLVVSGQGSGRPRPCGEPQQIEGGAAMAAQALGMPQAVIDGPAQPIQGDLPVSIIPARRVGDAKDGCDSLGLEPFGEEAIPKRVGPGEVTAFALQGGIQPRVDDYKFRGGRRVGGKLHLWDGAPPGAVAIEGVAAVGQSDAAVALDPEEAPEEWTNNA